MSTEQAELFPVTRYVSSAKGLKLHVDGKRLNGEDFFQFDNGVLLVDNLHDFDLVEARLKAPGMIQHFRKVDMKHAEAIVEKHRAMMASGQGGAHAGALDSGAMARSHAHARLAERDALMLAQGVTGDSLAALNIDTQLTEGVDLEAAKANVAAATKTPDVGQTHELSGVATVTGEAKEGAMPHNSLSALLKK